MTQKFHVTVYFVSYSAKTLTHEHRPAGLLALSWYTEVVSVVKA